MEKNYLEERMDIRRKTDNEQGIDEIIKDLTGFLKILNSIKEDRPTTKCDFWLTLKTSTKGDR